MINTLISIISIIGVVGNIKNDNFIIQYITVVYSNYKNSQDYKDEKTLTDLNLKHKSYDDDTSSFEEI